MERNGINLVRDKGKEIPALVLESALLHCGAAVSLAYAHADSGTPVVEVFQQTLKDIDHPGGALGYVNDLLEETKDHKVLLHFSSQDKDLQPFTLLCNDKDEPTLVAFLVGDFSEFKAKDGHTLEYMAADEDLGTKVLDLFEKAEEDIPKLLTKLKEPNVTRDLSKLGTGDFLNCTMLANNGEILAFCRPKSPPVKYDWGAASEDPVEVKAAAAEPKAAEPVPEKKLTLKERMEAKKAAAAGGTPVDPPAEPKKEEPKKEEALPPGQHRITEPATGKPLESLADRMRNKKLSNPVGLADKSGDNKTAQALHVVGIPPVFDKEKNRRKWYAQRGATGEVNVDFPDWKTRTTPILVTLDKLQACHSKNSIEEITKKYPVATAEEIKMYSGSQVPLTKKVEEPAAAAAVSEKPAFSNVIPPEHKAQLRERLLKKPTIVALVDKKGQSIADPTFLPAMEDKTPLWTESLGLPNIHAADWWKTEQFFDMGAYSMITLATAAAQYKLLWLKSEAALMQAKGESLPGTATGVAGTEAKLSLSERMALKKHGKAA